jgi:hypothetical protein
LATLVLPLDDADRELSDDRDDNGVLWDVTQAGLAGNAKRWFVRVAGLDWFVACSKGEMAFFRPPPEVSGIKGVTHLLCALRVLTARSRVIRPADATASTPVARWCGTWDL